MKLTIRSLLAPDHVRENYVARIDHAQEVNCQDFLPKIGRGLEEREQTVPAGAINQDIDLVEHSQGFIAEFLNLFAVGYVRLDRDNPPVRGLADLQGRVVGFFETQIADDDIGSGSGKGFHDRAANAPSAACDDY